MNTETFTNAIKYVIIIIKKTSVVINREALKIIESIMRNDNKVASIVALVILTVFSSIMQMLLVVVSISYLIEIIVK